MKLFSSFIFVLIVPGFFYLAEAADGTNQFRRCYNTTEETHCFDAQYDTTYNRWLTTSYEKARQRCIDLKSTLIIIKDEETNNIVNNYISDSYNPIRFLNVWIDAYRVSDYNNTYTWHWVNSTLPNLPASEVADIRDSTWYVASLEFKNESGNSQFHLTAQQPHFPNSYVCEYSVSRCPTTGSNVLQFADRCYVSVIASVSWYEARNRCLIDGGDLASFSNVSSINFTSWLVSNPNIRYWIGLRVTWYTWKDSGRDVKFAKWIKDDAWGALCLIVCYYCNPSFSWRTKDCNTNDPIYVVCHSLTPLQATTLTTASATTLPVTTSANIATQTGNTQSNNTEPNTAESEKNTWSPPIALAVGVAVGVGVPVIVAIIVIVICVVRMHQSKKEETSTTRQGHREETFRTEVQTGNGEGDHYATVRSLSPSKPMAIEKESVSEIQYETLGFTETADSKNGNGQFPLNVL